MSENLEPIVFKKQKKIKAINIVIVILAIISAFLLQISVRILIGDKTIFIYKIGVDSSQSVSKEEAKTDEEEQANSTVEAEKLTHKYPKITNAGINNILNIYKTDYKRVFLTFDDGPSENVTPQILDILEKNEIKATFFVLGASARKSPEILKREFDSGHFIANHSYTHIYDKIYSSTDAVLDEFNQTKQAVKEALGDDNYNTVLFRFPRW
jgi:peptidoglycan/xylan/chitin deacetylase (PgdA/CDA1 family)